VNARLKELDGADLELVIIDDSSGPPSYPVADFHQGKRGAVHCLNIGIEKASNDIVFAIGDDISIPSIEQFLDELRSCFRSSPVVGFNVIDKYQRLKVPRLVRSAMWELCGQLFPERGDEYKRAKGIFTCAFAFDKSRLKERYDENFQGSGFNAEVDFLIGHDVLYSPKLKVYHDYQKSGSRTMMLQNRRYFLKKHFRFWRFRLGLYMAYLVVFPLLERVYFVRPR
jgi:hypothetical protein